MAGYERYKSLVKEAWQHYCQGDHAGMARSLEQSLEYTPYLKTETISDWVARFVELASHMNLPVDIDALSESAPWDILSFYAENTVYSTSDNDYHKFYLFNQSYSNLTDEAKWISLPIDSEAIYILEGEIASQQLNNSKRAVIQFNFLDEKQELILSNYQNLSKSKKLGWFYYIPIKSEKLSLFKIKFITPKSAKYVNLGFRTWYSKVPVIIGSKIKIKKQSKLVYIPKFKLPEASPNSNLVIATLLDSFSEVCFRYEANLIPIEKSSWRQQFEQYQPSFFFAESIWRGNDGKWTSVMTKYKEKKDNPLREIIDFCRERGIKTVFWNKEDPPNFNLFIDAAKEFDYIFTVDQNCIDTYKNICGHNQVYSLPFAAQPYIHNPGWKPKESKDICFAGSWFANKHPERKELLPILLDPALNRNLHIYDRMLNENRDDYSFPEKYQKVIVGSLDIEQMLTAYRSYKIFLNVNTVTDSPTMFSRRVFELLGCGTPVISTKSIGVETMLGNFVKIAHNSTVTSQHIDTLLEDEEYRQKLAHIGYRYVHENHTYKHRLNYVLQKLEMTKYQSAFTQPLISVVAATNRPENLNNCLENFTGQKHENKELLLILNNNSYNLKEVRDKVAHLPNIQVFQVDEEKTLGECLNLGVNHAKGKYIAKFDDDDLYGPHFLGDMILPFYYTDAAIIGKQTYYGYLQNYDQLVIRFSGREHRYTNLVSGGTMVIKRQVLDQISFPCKPFGTDTAFLKSCIEQGLKIWSSDKYNFIQVRKQDMSKHTWKIDVQDYLKQCQTVSSQLDLAQAII